MKTAFKKYGRKDNHDLCELMILNDSGMEVKILNYGATLEKVLLSGDDLILSLNSPADYSKERNFWVERSAEFVDVFTKESGNWVRIFCNFYKMMVRIISMVALA